MILVGDIGNTETKICLINSKKNITKRFKFKTNNLNLNLLRKSFKKIKLEKIYIKKCLFTSVVPNSFKIVKYFFRNSYKIKCLELKSLPLNKLIKIKVNKKQVGSDRIANAIALSSQKGNYIILDFGTATTFDVLIKDVYYGGVIAPGVSLSLSTLINKASLIPYVDLKKNKKSYWPKYNFCC